MEKDEILLQKIRDEIEYQKFIINGFMVSYFSIFAFLGALFIGFTSTLKDDLIIFIEFSFSIGLLLLLAYLVFKKKIGNREAMIYDLRAESNKIYEGLLKNAKKKTTKK